MEVRKLKDLFTSYKSWEKYSWYRSQVESGLSNNAFPILKSMENPHIIYDPVIADCNVQYKMLIMISSHAAHFKRRQLIRATWGNYTTWKTKEPWKVIFVLGGTLNKKFLEEMKIEGEKYKDILLEDFEEDYYKLSLKVIIGLQWAITKFKFHFVMKGDDDVFVQVDRLMLKINGEYANEHYVGNVMSGTPVFRKGRYKLTKEEHPKDIFDPYCSGGGFLLSSMLIMKIIPLFNWKSPLRIDDAYFGQLVSLAGIKPKHVPDGFFLWNGWCEYRDTMLISHPATIEKCMHFLTRRGMIDSGLLVDDKIKSISMAFPPDEKKLKKIEDRKEKERKEREEKAKKNNEREVTKIAKK